MKFQYPKQIRERARAEGKGMMAIDLTRKNGKSMIAVYGPVSDDDMKEIAAFVCGLLEKWREKPVPALAPRPAEGGER